MGFFTDLVKQGLGITPVQKALQWAGQNLPESITTPAIQAEQVMRNPPMLQLPRFEMPKFLPSTVQYFGNIAVNMPQTIAESAVNTPSLLLKGVSNTGLDLAGQINHGERKPLSTYAADIAPFAEGMLNIGTGIYGGSLFKNAAKEAIAPVVKQSVSQILKSGAKSIVKGTGIGAGYGLVGGLQETSGQSVDDMINNALKKTAIGAGTGAVLGPTMELGTKMVGKAYGTTKDMLSKMTPAERQSGKIDIIAPVGKQFKEPYVRGDKATIEKQLDAVLNTESHMNGKWNSRIPARETAFKELEHYAQQGDQGAVDALNKALALQADLSKAEISKATQIPEIKTLTGKSVKDILAKKKQPIVSQPVTPEIVKPVGPGSLPWEEAGYVLPKGKTPESLPEGFVVNKKKQMVPLNPKAEQLTVKELISKKNTAEVQGENKVNYNDILARNIGKREAAKTRGMQQAIKVNDIPKEKQWDVIRAREGTLTTSDPVVNEKVGVLKQIFDEAHTVAKNTGLPIDYIDNYVTHIWKETPQQVEKAYKSFKTTLKYAHERKYPTYDEGLKMGLTPKFTNPAQIVNEYVTRLHKVVANVEMFKELQDNGLLISGKKAAGNPDFVRIDAVGFPRHEVQVNGEKTVISDWYAPKALADKINQIANPNEASWKGVEKLAKVSSAIQDVSMSGGIPKTPINAWTAAQTTKEILSGRVKAPVKAIAISMSEKATQKYNTENSQFIIEQQEQNVPIHTTFNSSILEDKGAVKRTLGEKVANSWNKAINEPTFKRFMPILQTEFYKDIRAKAIKMGKSEGEAIKVATQAVKNWYGLKGTDITAFADQNKENVIKTLFFAPKYRESMWTFWGNNLKSLIKPTALENRANIRFLVGSVLTLTAMNAINKVQTGKNMWENPPGKEDKMLIKIGDGYIGVPFLSSIATMPRMAFKIGKNIVSGDLPQAAREAKGSLSQMIRPVADVVTNEDYFGNKIVEDNSQNPLLDRALYVAGQVNHPYIRELVNAGMGNLPDSMRQQLGMTKKSVPAYQAISQALELPFRFYNKTNGNDPLETGYYYQTRDEILKGMSTNDKATWEKLHPSDKVDNGALNSQQKAMLYLNNPQIQVREMILAQALKTKLGQDYDPVWDLPADQRNQIFAARTSLPGEKNTVKAEISKQSWYAEFNKMEADYYDKLYSKIGPQTSDTGQPTASDYVQSQMDVKNWKDPQVQQYLNDLSEYNNNKRTSLGLSPIAPYSGSKSSSYGINSTYEKYKWSNLKSKNKAAITKSVKGIFKTKKIKVQSVKSVLSKIKASKKRKSLKVILAKAPKFKTKKG
jgi:hypothetical protein